MWIWCPTFIVDMALLAEGDNVTPGNYKHFPPGGGSYIER